MNFTKKNMHTTLSFLCNVFERIKVHQSAFLGVAVGGIEKEDVKKSPPGIVRTVDHDVEEEEAEEEEEEEWGAGHTLAQESVEVTRKIIHDACYHPSAKHHPHENASLASLLVSSSSSSSLVTLYAVRKCIGRKRPHGMEEEDDDDESEAEEDCGEEIRSMIEAQKERQKQEHRIQGLLRLLMEA